MGRPLKPFYDAEKQGWYIRPQGQRIRLAPGPKNSLTRKQAEEAFCRYLMEEKPLDPEEPDLKALLETYLFHYQQEAEPRSVYERQRILEEFLAAMPANILVRNLLPFHLTQFIAARKDRWKSTDTQANVIKHIKAPFGWAIKQGLLKVHPFLSITGAFGNRRRPVTDEEFEKLLQASWPRLQEILRFIRLTGARPCEIRALCWEHLDLDRGVLILTKHKTSRTRKDRAPRMIVLVEEALEILIQIRRRQEHAEYIFLNRCRRPLKRNSVALAIKRIKDRIGLPQEVILYGIRHSFGTRAVMAGMNLKILAELMGHTSTRMTEHYVHVAGQINHLRSALSQIVPCSGGPAPQPPEKKIEASQPGSVPDNLVDADHKSGADNR